MKKYLLGMYDQTEWNCYVKLISKIKSGMERKETNNIDKQTRILGDQIHAVDDLEIFRTMLRQEIKSLLQETSGQPVQQWMKSSEVRKMLGVSPETLQNLRVNGTLPFTKISSIVFYQYEDIVKLLNNQISK